MTKIYAILCALVLGLTMVACEPPADNKAAPQKVGEATPSAKSECCKKTEAIVAKMSECCRGNLYKKPSEMTGCCTGGMTGNGKPQSACCKKTLELRATMPACCQKATFGGEKDACCKTMKMG